MSEATGDGRRFAERWLDDLQLPDLRHAVLRRARLADRPLHAHRHAVSHRGTGRPRGWDLCRHLPIRAALTMSPEVAAATRANDVRGNCPVTRIRMSWVHQAEGGPDAL